MARPAVLRPPMAMPATATPAMASPAIPESFVPTEPVAAGPRYGEAPPADDFSFDGPPTASRSKVRTRPARDEEDEDDDRPRRNRRRDEEDDEDDRPRGRAAKAEKKSSALPYILVAMVAMFLLALLSFAGYHFLVREKPVPTEPTVAPKPKPTAAPQTKPTVKEPPKDWERVEDQDFTGFMPKAGILEKKDGLLAKPEDMPPELGEAHGVVKIVSRDPGLINSAYVVTIRNSSLAKVNEDHRAMIGEWSQIFLAKVPENDLTITDFNNDQFKYKGKQYVYEDERGVRHFFRMFVAHDKFYVLRVIGADLPERGGDQVKTFFDNFQPTR